MKISFTTLSCPDWKWEKIIEQAVELGYDGLEIRGIEGEMYLPKARPFLPENIDTTMELLRQNGLEICCLDTSCKFHDKDSYAAFLAEGKATIDLACRLGVPYIRVFGDAIPEPSKKNETITQVAQGLEELGRYAEGKNVMVLIETHGDFSASTDLLEVLKKTSSSSIGILWDVNHPYKAYGEPLKDTYERLKDYIRHVHLKDSIGMGKGAKLCLVGEGDLPVPEAVKLLEENGYQGYLSLEWEKKWHPDLPEPEIAIPDFIKYIRQYI